MRILIVEDEELAAEKLRHMIAAIDDSAEIAGCTGSIESTVAWLLQHSRPDLLLMDIELSDGQSFEIFNRVEVHCPVIFTTSYDEYAIRAFKVNSIDYLLKPILKDDLAKAFDKYRKLKRNTETNGTGIPVNIANLLAELSIRTEPKEYRRRFLVKQGSKHLPVEIEEIAYFFVHERVIFFKTFDGRRFIVDYTLDEVEKMINPAMFFKVNRSFIVAVGAIHQLHDYINSRLLLSLTPPVDGPVVVSREKVAEFKSWIGK